MAGFPIISFLPELFKIEDTQIYTFPYRIICLISAIITIIVGIKIKIYSLINTKHRVLLLFLVLYLIRVSFDLYYSEYSEKLTYQFPNKSMYYMFILGVAVIPMISILTIISIDLLKVARYFYYLTLLALSFAISMNNIDIGQIVENRINGNTALASIIYGQLGVTGFLLSIFLWTHFKNKFQFVLYIIGGILSLYTIIIAGSRSPFIALLICTILYLYYLNPKTNISKFITRVLLISFILFVIFSPDKILKLIGNYSPTSEQRIMNTFDKSADQFSGRDLLYKDAFADFLDSPIIGKHFVLTHGTGAGWYPHNVILEVFMALGVIGGVIFVYLLFFAFKNSFKLIKYNNKAAWFSLLFMQIIVFAFFSGSLYTTSSLWIMLFLLLVSPNYYLTNQTLKKIKY
jgi:O-antigen ligase